MNFTGKTEIQANINATFAAFADFDAFERSVRRSGGKIERVDGLTTPGPGMMWRVVADYRGKPRKIDIDLKDYEPPESLLFSASSTGFDATIMIELSPLSGKETRARIVTEITARSIAARLLLQSARLTKGKLNKRFRPRFRKFGDEMTQRILSA
jgi:hypothetical protein